MKKHDFILKMFTGNDNLRPALSMPGIIDNQVYATDAHCCIRFNKEKVDVDYSVNEGFPKADHVFKDLDFEKKSVVVVDEILTKIYELELKFNNDVEKCYKCDGEGETECCECGNLSDCKECDGEGAVEVDTPFAKLSLHGNDIEILGKTVAPKFLYKVLEAAYFLRQNKMTVKYDLKSPKLLFCFDGIEILVMTKSKSV